MLKCQHCFYHYATSTPETELSFDEYRAMSAHMGPFSVALICGGEPYWRPDLGEIISMLRKNHGVPLAANTSNGQLTSSVVNQTVAILRADRYKPFGVGLSMDGPREIHDEIRGKGSFERTQRTFRELKKLQKHYPNLNLTVTTVVNRINQHHAAGFVRWAARELEPNALCVLLVRQGPRAGESLKEVELDNYRAAQEAAVSSMRSASRWGRLRPDAAYLEAVAKHVAATRVHGAKTFHCWAGVNGALIDPLGMVQVCEVFPEHGLGQVGSLRDWGMDFDGLWNSPAADAMRAHVNTHAACADCTHETMGHATSLPFSPNWVWSLQKRVRPAPRAAAPAAIASHAPIPVERLRARREPVATP
jgi:MoaA/NifB/PqqE/SkfB family radical SAM enzyme